MDGNPDVWEGLCGSCNDWIALVSSKKKGTTWFRHAYKVRPPLVLVRQTSTARVVRFVAIFLVNIRLTFPPPSATLTPRSRMRQSAGERAATHA